MNSSSSMTAISRCPDTWNPCPELNEEAGRRNFCMQMRCSGIIQECYGLRRSDAGTADNQEVGQRFQSKRSSSVWCRRTTALRPAFPERPTLTVTPRPPLPATSETTNRARTANRATMFENIDPENQTVALTGSHAGIRRRRPLAWSRILFAGKPPQRESYDKLISGTGT